MSRRQLTGAMALIGAMAAVQLPASGQLPPPTCPPGTGPTLEFPCTPLPGDPGGLPGGLPPCLPGQVSTAQAPCSPIPPGGLPGGGIVPCAPGQQPSPALPCTPIPGTGGPGGGPGGGAPPCPPGVQTSAQFPCTPNPAGGQGGPGPGGNGGPPPLPRCEEDQQPSREDPCRPPGGPEGGPGGPGDGGTPTLMGGFLNKVWKFNAEVDGYDAADDVLNCTITKILNLSKQFKDQDDEIVDSDSYILFSASTKVYNEDGKRVTKETKYDGLLDRADTVRIQGKVVPPQKWREDEDGTPTPTVRAKRVYVTG